MKKTFADTSYWVATLDETDQYFSAAMQANTKLGNSELVTTESVLIEVLNYFSGFPAQVKVICRRLYSSNFDGRAKPRSSAQSRRFPQSTRTL